MKAFTMSFIELPHFIAKAGEKFYGPRQTENHRRRFLELVCNFKLILGSPILTNAGRTVLKSISACSIPAIKLSTQTHEQISKIVGSYHTRGMGTGFCLDDLDNQIEMVKYLNDLAIKEVQTGQIERSVGNMGVLSIDHPQVLAFISLKRDNPQIKEWKFNLSVNLTDKFLTALNNNELFPLKNGELVNPQVVMMEIAECAHATGDPGIVFMDRINQLNRVPHVGRYKTVVPCGEVSLFDGEVCQFSYLNLPSFLKNNTIDRDELRFAIHAAVLLLDNAVEANIQRMPNEQSAEIISSLRRIGIGVCGFAEVLQAMGLPYGSEKARELASDLMSFINFESKWASIVLAKQRGPFKLFDHPETRKDLFIQPFQNHPTNFVSKEDWDQLAKFFKTYMIRNLATTILPPSGRSSLIAGVTGSIEPPFRLVADSACKSALERQCRLHGCDVNLQQIYEHINTVGSIQDTALSPTIKEIFKTAIEIAPEDHLLMAKAFQQHVDEGISKTVNLPRDATVDDVRKVFMIAYDLKLKGITVYRNGSREFQPKSLTITPGTSMPSQIIQDRIYGDLPVSKRVAKLLESKLVARLKQVHQNGTNFLIDPRQSTSRYEHSVGTLALTIMLGGDESTQIAALLHDISHTAFSHVIDLVFANTSQNYHDLMREKFLSSPEAHQTLKECVITPKELSCHSIPMVKGECLNVDRLDYAIRDLLRVNRIYHPEYSSILNNLVVDKDGKIKCKNVDTARLIFNKFIEANLEIYFNAKAEVAAIVMAKILQSMLRQNLIVEEDFFSTDDAMIAKILQSPFKSIFEKIEPEIECYPSTTATNYPAALRKIRYVNPQIVGIQGNLTDHCQDSKKRLHTYLTTTPTKVFYQIPILEKLQ